MMFAFQLDRYLASSKKGQTSMELMVYVGVALLILGYVFVFLYPQSNRSINEMNSYYADLLASSLASNINSVYSLGSGSEYTVRLNIQKGVSKVEVTSQGNGGEVTVKFVDNGKTVDVVKPFGAKLCDSFTFDPKTTGNIRLRISSVDSNGGDSCVKIETID